MDMIIAKPVVDKKFWILQQGDEKVGNVEATDTGYQVKINNQVQEYKTIKMVEQRVNVQFEKMVKTVTKPATDNVHGYPTSSRVYNPIWNVQYKLPLYTKNKKSKSWYAAGWYVTKQGREWEVEQDPKLIVLERYPYKGPYYTKEEAEANESI